MANGSGNNPGHGDGRGQRGGGQGGSGSRSGYSGHGSSSGRDRRPLDNQSSSMRIFSARFAACVVDESGAPNDNLPIVALVGRSNVGKSSFINCLANRRELAKTSSTPGKTLTLNYYLINESFYLVDLPGYGYAKASKVSRARIQQMVDGFFERTANLRGVVLLLDMRHAPMESDKAMWRWLLEHRTLRCLLLLTKCDKCGRSQQIRQQKVIHQRLKVNRSLMFSAKTAQGRIEALEALANVLGLGANAFSLPHDPIDEAERAELAATGEGPAADLPATETPATTGSEAGSAPPADAPADGAGTEPAPAGAAAPAALAPDGTAVGAPPPRPDQGGDRQRGNRGPDRSRDRDRGRDRRFDGPQGGSGGPGGPGGPRRDRPRDDRPRGDNRPRDERPRDDRPRDDRPPRPQIPGGGAPPRDGQQPSQGRGQHGRPRHRHNRPGRGPNSQGPGTPTGGNPGGGGPSGAPPTGNPGS